MEKKKNTNKPVYILLRSIYIYRQFKIELSLVGSIPIKRDIKINQ